MKSIVIAIGLIFGLFMQLQAQWSHVGPIKDYTAGNLFETGRLDCICPDAGFNGTTNQTIYAGSSSGSLWVTTNFCTSWNPVQIPDYVTFHGISALAATPSGYMLAATINSGFVNGQGGNIYQYFPSTNTWVATNFNTVSGGSGVFVTHIKVCPSGFKIVLASTSNGVYRSADGGLTWTKVISSGSYENVDFVPGKLSVVPSGYFVYACGDNSVMYSTDFGLTFSTKTTVTSLLGASYYADLAITFDAITVNKQYIYFDALTASTASHRIVRLTINKTTGAESVNNYGTVSESITSGASTDRMCTAAYDQVVYFGNGGLAKFNAATNNFYQINSGNDFVSAYVWYANPGHADSHDIIMLPLLNRILYVNDGGCYMDSYVPSANGIYNNSWQQMNNNLNISQIWGMSCAEEDEDEYMTGEQDTKAFRTNSSTTTFYSGGVESSDVLIDKFNKNNFLLSTSGSVNTFLGNYNGPFPINDPDVPAPVGGDICNSVDALYCYIDPITQQQVCINIFPSAEFTTNTLFQDPNRPDKIFSGTKDNGLMEFCPTTGAFTAKKAFPGTWQQYINGIAFTKADNNKVYCLLSSRNSVAPDQEQPEVFKYTGTDFVNSWSGNNDSWTAITPNFLLPPFTTPEVYPNTAFIQFVGIAASDWNWTPNTDRIWVAMRYSPNNPQLKVLKYEAGIWTDYSTGIPQSEIPISLVYEQGTNDQMYLGTNVNVYVRDATMSSWQLYSANLPNLAMDQLRINYKENTVRVGTYGQGMWKSSLQCPPNSTLSVTGTVTTDNFYQAALGVTVQNHTVSSGDIKYRSGTEIDFLPDVLITGASNCTAFAFIHGCTGPGNTFRPAEDDGNSNTELMNAPENEEEKPSSGISTQVEKIYPNPTTGILNIEAGFLINDISIYDLTGRIVFHEDKQDDNKVSVSIKGQPSGIYLVRISGENNCIIRKIILQ